jgi:hypothetical protein
MTSEELAGVVLAGQSMSFSHAVLIETADDWHVELEDLPADSCPFVRGECEISLDTWDGEHYEGTVTVSHVSEGRSYLLLTGKGPLACSRWAPADDAEERRAA